MNKIKRGNQLGMMIKSIITYLIFFKGLLHNRFIGLNKNYSLNHYVSKFDLINILYF